MFDHVKFGVSDYAASKSFFLKALEPLGVTVVTEWPPNGVELSQPKGKVSLCLYQTGEKPAHLHLAFVAGNRQQVDAFYRAALAAGGKDNGAPGLRPHYHANYLLRLIDDVLDFSKIESGRMALESVPVEIVPVVEEAFELVAEKAREKDLALLFDMQDDVPYYILGDATRIRQIMLNLLSNAIKFTARGQVKFTLSSRRTADGGLELEGCVADTGIGIPAERAGQLFQPFTQVDASTTRKYGGTGLGLAIARELTRAMGGELALIRTGAEGATFRITLPAG